MDSLPSLHDLALSTSQRGRGVKHTLDHPAQLLQLDQRPHLAARQPARLVERQCMVRRPCAYPGRKLRGHCSIRSHDHAQAGPGHGHAQHHGIEQPQEPDPRENMGSRMVLGRPVRPGNRVLCRPAGSLHHLRHRRVSAGLRHVVAEPRAEHHVVPHCHGLCLILVRRVFLAGRGNCSVGDANTCLQFCSYTACTAIGKNSTAWLLLKTRLPRASSGCSSSA